VILALVALDAVFLDQGALLSPMLGKIATSADYIHEFAHDVGTSLPAHVTEAASMTSARLVLMAEDLLERCSRRRPEPGIPFPSGREGFNSVPARRGALAGGSAGLGSGGYSLLAAEPVLDRAVRLAAAHGEAGGAGSATAEVFSRSTQHVGLVVAAVPRRRRCAPCRTTRTR
jgi:hypothetical protein